MIDGICISGGGNKCLTFVGALTYLIRENIINIENIKHYYGTSGGAIICYFLVLGYTIEEIEKFVFTFNFFKCINTNLNLDNLLNYNGLDDGSKLIYVMEELIKNKYGVKDMTLLALYNLTKKEFVIIGTNYTKGIERLFSYKTTPDLSVIKALRISISIPFIFIPVLYEDDYYVDGGITNNFPINHCNQDTTIGLFVKGTIKNNFSNDLTNLVDIYFNCFNIMFDSSAEKVIQKYNNVITIVNTPEMLKKGFSDFNLDESYLKFLFDLGYNCTKLHYENIDKKI